MNIKKILLLSIIIISMINGCNIANESVNGYDYIYSIPESSDDSWEVASLGDAGMNELNLGMMMDRLNTNDHRIHSIVIVKDGKLVFEEYFKGYKFGTNPPGSDGEYIQYDKDTNHFIASITKSITSTLLGIAIKEGFVESVNDKIIDYFPEYTDILIGDKNALTIKHLLTMSSGLPWDETTYPIGDSRNDTAPLFNESDPIRWVLKRPLEFLPGTTFKYNSGTTNVLAALIEEASKKNMEEFMDKYLFNPIGIKNEDYLIDALSSGRLFMSGGMHMSPRELLKIGSIYLNEGKWGNNKILDDSFIKMVQENHMNPPGYGFQWWLHNFNINGISYPCFYAAGWGGQYMFIFPGENLIIQIFSGYYLTAETIDPFDMVENYILKSLSN